MSASPSSRRFSTPSLKDFGARGDGVTDDSSVLLEAINYSVSAGYDEPTPILVPAGRYILSETNLLGQWNSINTSVYKGIIGPTFIGSGPRTSVFVLQNDSSSDTYFYDGYDGESTAENNGMLWPTFRDLGFEGEATGSGKVHGFRQYAVANGYPSQKWRFINCDFRNMGTVLFCQGETNASENAFLACTGSRCDTFLDVSNPQSFNHTFLGCDFELAKSDIFKFTGGAGLVVNGGSYITDDDATADQYLLSTEAGAGGLTGFFSINGVRTELRSIYGKVLKVRGVENAAIYAFSSCGFRVVTGGRRESISIAAKSRAHASFNLSEFTTDHAVKWEDGTANYWLATGPWSSLRFDRCRRITSSSITWGENTLGTTEITGNLEAEADFEGDGQP